MAVPKSKNLIQNHAPDLSGFSLKVQVIHEVSLSLLDRKGLPNGIAYDFAPAREKALDEG